MKELVKPYLLYVGNFYPHKNLQRLISAFEDLVLKDNLDYQLVLVGGERGSRGNVLFTGPINDEELDLLYRHAALYALPSLYEGFGLTALEAMARGLAVVSSDVSCLPEILGDAVIYFNPLSVDDIRGKIKKVLADKSLKDTLIKRGQELVKKYNWREMAEKTLNLYKNIPS